jgi:hypothetical protein
MHAYEIVAYRHPDNKYVFDNQEESTAYNCQVIYLKLVHGLHLEPECREDMIRRLSEDRIATGTVVS